VRIRIEHKISPGAARRPKQIAELDLTCREEDRLVLAAHALRARLIDEGKVNVLPLFLGGGSEGNGL